MGLAAEQLEDALLYSDGGHQVALVKSTKAGLYEKVGRDRLHKFPFVFVNKDRLSIVMLDVDDVDDDPAESGTPQFLPGLDEATYGDRGMPTPNFGISTSGARYQAGYVLKEPLRRPDRGCSVHSFSYYRAIRDQHNYSLNGDHALPYRGWARNPLCETAKVRHFHSHGHQLGDLDIGLKIDARLFHEYSRKYEIGNRNRATFGYALREFKASGDKLSMDELMTRIGTFQSLTGVEALGRGENRGIAVSVQRNGGRYQGRRFDPRWNVGVLGFTDPGWGQMTRAEREAELKDRWACGALHCHEVRKASTLERLRGVLEGMVRNGDSPSKKGLAKAAGVDRNTVRRHWLALTGEG